MTRRLEEQIADATFRMAAWLRDLQAWPTHPVNASGSVSAHFGPTILSEHDCVLHYARFLADAGLAWEDMHLELSPGQWMYETTGTRPKRIDLAIVRRERLAAATLPGAPGSFPLDAVFEFALASSFWQHGVGSPGPLRAKVDADVGKVGEYLSTGLASRGYVLVVEECDHDFAADYVANARSRAGVEVLLLQRWRPS